MMPLTYGSLFSGIGGMDLGFDRAGMICKWQVEIDGYARRVLAKHWPDVPRWDDVRTFPPRCADWGVDVIAGGFPCQDISYAGRGAGLEGERSGLFFEAIRVVQQLRPRVVVLENVAALLTRGLDRVLGELAEIGFDAEWHCIPAAAVGAPHIRDRVFIIGVRADTELARTRYQSRTDCGQEREQATASEPETLRQAHRAIGAGRANSVCADVANAAEPGNTNRQECSRRDGSNISGAGVSDTDKPGLEKWAFIGVNARQELASVKRICSEWPGQWAVEPNVGRVADGVPSRVDRLRCLGNAIVPQVAEYIGRLIIEASNQP